MTERPISVDIERSYDPERDRLQQLRRERDALQVEVELLREALCEAVALLDDSRCDLTDPALRRAWGRRRKAVRNKLSNP